MDGRRESAPSPLLILGAVMLAAGFLACVYFFVIFDTSVPAEEGRRIANISLISQRSTGVVFGAALLVAGAVLLGLSRVRSRP